MSLRVLFSLSFSLFLFCCMCFCHCHCDVGSHQFHFFSFPFCAPKLYIIFVRSKSLWTEVNVLFIQWVQWSTAHSFDNCWSTKTTTRTSTAIYRTDTNSNSLDNRDHKFNMHTENLPVVVAILFRWWREIRIKQYDVCACVCDSAKVDQHKQISNWANRTIIISSSSSS